MNARPSVSVIVPAYHSAVTLARCLSALGEQTTGRVQVIVVNSSPSDGSARIAADFESVVYIESHTRLLPHAARNQGASVAAGDVLAFTDPDCQPRRDWVAKLLGCVERGHPLVCGAIEPAHDMTWREWGTHLCKYSFRLAGLPAGPVTIAGTANACLTRELWNDVGPFEGERFSGDGLLSWRASANGAVPWFEPGAVVYHRDAEPFGAIALWRERVSRGRDFGEGRVAHEDWSCVRALGYLAALPALPILMSGRGLTDARRAGRARMALATLPLQLLGHAGWCVGEAGAHWARASRRARTAGATVGA